MPKDATNYFDSPYFFFATSLPYANTTPSSEQPRRYIHGHQLLEQQLRRIRNMHLGNLGCVVTRSALKLLLLEISVHH